MPTPPPTTIVGWREYVDLPAWSARGIKAKIDTGARTSAIDVGKVVELPGGERVRFDVVLSRGLKPRTVTVEAEISRRTRVKSSFGHAHDRLFVKTLVRVGPHQFEAELGLVSRPTLICRMLLGRSALEGRFVVDPGHRYLVSRRRRGGDSRSEI